MRKQKSRFDQMGDRQKRFEVAEAGRRCMPGLPILARLDGRAFSSFTRSLKKPGEPFNAGLSKLMQETVKYLVRENKATLGYTQSDEITLAFLNPGYDMGTVEFDGRMQKLVSTLTADAVYIFNELKSEYLPEKKGKPAKLDCRVWQVPDLAMAAEAFEWRELDAAKNSLTMAASAFYSHRELDRKNSAHKHEMLMAKGVNWANYPTHFKRGVFARKVTVARTLSDAELQRIPAGKRPTGPVIRTEVQVVEFPRLSTVVNKVEMLFFGEPPELGREEDLAA
jgi:tRNA(His) guanylyltransferase